MDGFMTTVEHSCTSLRVSMSGLGPAVHAWGTLACLDSRQKAEEGDEAD